jgi:hypothetical protein
LALPLYADECVDGRILAGLRRRGIDITTADEQGLLSADDVQHVARAAELGRCLVTSDRDFLVIASNLLSRELFFPGLFFIQSHAKVGEAVRALAEAALFRDPVDMKDRIDWIP